MSNVTTEMTNTMLSVYLVGDSLAGGLLAQQTDLEAAALHEAQHLSVDLLRQLSGGRQQQGADAVGAGCFQVRQSGDHAAHRD